jgi:hypothetical protein
MAYLIDLTLVLHDLFYDLPDVSRTVTKDTIAEAFERYNKCVHYEVHQYVRVGDWGREAAEKKMKAPIMYYSSPEYHAGRITN